MLLIKPHIEGSEPAFSVAGSLINSVTHFCIDSNDPFKKKVAKHEPWPLSVAIDRWTI